MVLAIDVGNSNVVVGISDGAEWQYIWRLPTNTHQDASLFYQMQLTNRLFEHKLPADAIKKAVISSVVPSITETIRDLVLHLFTIQPIIVGPDIYNTMSLILERPDELGTDLFANAVAAHYLHQKDCIIVDFGTALTFTTVTAEGKLLGVSIAPGLKTAISALYSKTAQLPEVPLELPDSVIGKNTVHAIQSGVLIGYIGLVKHMIKEIRKELGVHYIAIATGGLSTILKPLEEEFEVIDPQLTLNGLKLISEKIDE